MPSFREQLAQARWHVVQAKKRIEDQVVLIERLKSEGYNTGRGAPFGRAFIDLMSKLTLHRDELEREAEERARSFN